MSPRQYIEIVWPSLFPGVALIDASNNEIQADGLVSPWVGMLVQAESNRYLTLGGQPYGQELGTIMFGVFTESGKGPTDGDILARQIMDLFMGWQSNDKLFEVNSINGPYDLEPESDGNWHRLAVELNYGRWWRQL